MVWGYLSYAGIAAVFVNAPRFTTAIGLYFALFAITGLPNAAAQIGFDSTAQLLCPPAVLGRLSGLAAAAGAGGAIAGTVVIALLVDSVHVVPLFNAQAGVYLLCGIAADLFVIRPLHAGPTTSE